MSLIDDGDKDAPPRGMKWRFEPVVTTGNLISIGAIICFAIGAFWDFNASIAAQNSAVNDRISTQQIQIATLTQGQTINAAAIQRDEDNARRFDQEMRDRLDKIFDAISTLKEDVARNGIGKTR